MPPPPFLRQHMSQLRRWIIVQVTDINVELRVLMRWPINNEEAHKFSGLHEMTREIFTDVRYELSAVSIHGEQSIDILWPYHYCQVVILIAYPRVYLHTLAQIYMNMPRLNFKQITIGCWECEATLNCLYITIFGDYLPVISAMRIPHDSWHHDHCVTSVVFIFPSSHQLVLTVITICHRHTPIKFLLIPR